LAIGSVGSNGTPTLTVVASGESTAPPLGATLIVGLNGTSAQPEAPTAVVKILDDFIVTTGPMSM